jgi:Ca-activated chloride channel homolog
MTPRRLLRLLAVLVSLPLSLAAAQESSKPIALRVDVQPLGKGTLGTVMGIVVEVAPVDRERVGERVQVTLSLLEGDDLVDRHSAVVPLEADGTTMLYRDWKLGSYQLQVGVAAVEGEARGVWFGEIKVAEADKPFAAPEGASADALALQLLPPRKGAVRFLPPPEIGGIGALQLEVEVPEGTARVEFLQDGRGIGIRNRPPWTVSVPLGDVVRRTLIQAIAEDPDGRYLGEDAIVLNNPSGQLGVEILLGPAGGPKRSVTVAVSPSQDLSQVTLSLDDTQVARWASCPCVVDLPASDLAKATILAADALDTKGARGDSVLPLSGGGGFSGSVRVELVELPVLVLDAQGSPVTGLTQADFKVFEDDSPVAVEGFGTTADLPLSLGLSVDISGSMLEVFPQVRRAVAEFANELMDKGDESFLLAFSWDAKVLVHWTSAPSEIEARLADVTPEGGTSLHDAVVHSLEQFRGRRGRQALVLLTDGEDTTSRTGWETALRFARTMRVPIFPIGMGIGRLDFGSRGVLKKIAEETGGTAFFPKDVTELPAVYFRIGELLRSQYLLWYPSPSQKPPEKFRAIRVEVTGADRKVQTIRGYYPGK